jgi:FKBP-type peptidyl-prolyl cis-trans isomerase FklB
MYARVFVFVIVFALTACGQSGDKSVTLETRQDSVSYSIGMNVGMNLLKDSITVNPDAFVRGLLDAALDTSRRIMSDAEIDACMTAFQQELQMKQQERAMATSLKNKAEGEAFLADNGKKSGIVTTASGLQYRVITTGSGKKPDASSSVTTHYVGRLLDGTEFDSSVKRGQPATFPVNGVIKGWGEALQLMNEGSKWEVWIPPSLAYGESGAGGVIPPNATLVFEIELLSVK